MPFINRGPLNYPINTSSSIRVFQSDRAPTVADYKNFIVFDEWWDRSSLDFWKLVFKDGTQGIWRRMGGVIPPVESFFPDAGISPVVPNATNEVTFTGGTGIQTVGGLNTMTWNIDGDIANIYTEDVGTATPAANNLNIVGGTGIDTAGAGSTVTINADITLANLYTEDVGTATPAANNLNIVGGTGIDTAGAGSTVTINADITLANLYTADVGTATPAANNLNILGGVGVNTAGAGSTITINTAAGFAPISKYIVDPDGTGDYITIQAALDAANALAPDAAVYVRPGTYTENLTLYDGIDIWGAVGVADTETCKIIGVHTPPAAGTFTLRNIFLESATDIFNSAVAGTAMLILIDCAIDVTNGYTFNLVNWTGSFAGFDIGEIQSTNDGWINNTGGATVFMTNVTIGAGVGNPMITSGSVTLYNTIVQCPCTFGNGTSGNANGGCFFRGTTTFTGNGTLDISNSNFSTGATQALTHSSTSDISLADVTINTSYNPSIGGAGAGNLEIGSITFLDDTNIAGTVNLDYTTALETGVGYLNNISFDRGTNTISADGELIIGDTGGVPVISTLTAGVGIGITNGAGSITISGSGSGLAWVEVVAAAQAMAVATAYGANRAGGVTFTLPAAAAAGTVMEIVGIQGLWALAQNAGQTVHVGAFSTTAGAGGSLTATNAGDCIAIRCITANTDFRVQSLVGNITIV